MTEKLSLNLALLFNYLQKYTLFLISKTSVYLLNYSTKIFYRMVIG